ncbi:MAG: hypothetical protein R2712_12330 [Vicinamibacterales bacterium]
MDIELDDWLFDTTAGPERRAAEARVVHGHLLKPGDVARTPATASAARNRHATRCLFQGRYPGEVAPVEGGGRVDTGEEDIPVVTFEDAGVPRYRLSLVRANRSPHWFRLAERLDCPSTRAG